MSKDNVRQLYHRLLRQGLILTVEGKKLNVKGNPLLIKQSVDEIKENKPLLINYIQSMSESQLSWSQKGIWTAFAQNPQACDYNISFVLRLERGFDEQKFEQSFNHCVSKHPMLSGSYQIDEALEQVIHKRTSHKPRFVKYTTEDLNQDQMNAKIHELSNQPFDLSHEAPVRCVYIKNHHFDHHEDAYLLLLFHHIAIDFASIDILMAQLVSELHDHPLIDEEYSYYQFVQEQYLNTQTKSNVHNYWHQKQSLILNQPQTSSGKGQLISVDLDREQALQLKEYAQTNKVTLNTLMIALYAAAIKLSLKKCPTIFVPLLNRQGQKYKNTIGFMANTLPMLMDDDLSLSWDQWLQNVHLNLIDLLEIQHYPYPQLIEDGCFKEKPVLNYLYSYHDFRTIESQLKQSGLGSIHHFSQQGSLAPWLFTVNEFSNHLNLQVNFDSLNVSKWAAHQFIDKMLNVFKQIQHHQSNVTLDALNHEASSHLSRPIVENTSTILDAIQSAVHWHPEHNAIASIHGSLTYKELWEESSKVMTYLKAQGITSKQPIGIHLSRNPTLLVVLLGVIRLGCYYIPLEKKYPKERLQYILGKSHTRYVITDSPSQIEAEYLINITLLPWQKTKPLEFTHKIEPSDPIYALFTSGSTGEPKGVLVSHANVKSLIDWSQKTYTRDEAARCLASTSLSFDISVFEIYLPLSRGDTIYLADSILDLSNDSDLFNDITLINTVPSSMEALLDSHNVPNKVKVVNLAGEPLSRKLIQKIYRQTTVEKVYNLYGPTEATVYSTFTRVYPNHCPQVPIGQPLPYVQTLIVDDKQERVLDGMKGELYIGGQGVALGYINDAQMNQDKFTVIDGVRYYRSGDYVRKNIDGDLYFQGRCDNQIKHRGFRIELFEIEQCLMNIHEIQDAAVLQQGCGAQAKIVALVSFVDGCQLIETSALKDRCRQHLPAFMVPDDVYMIDVMPLLSNGKIDRHRLKNLAAQRSKNKVPSVTRKEGDEHRERFKKVLLELLAVDSINWDLSFFCQGGQSLNAMQLAFKLTKAFKTHVTLKDIMSQGSLEGLYQNIAQKQVMPEVKALEPKMTSSFAMTDVQQSIYYHQKQLTPYAYNIVFKEELVGQINSELLEQAILTSMQDCLLDGWSIVCDKNVLLNKYNPSRKITIDNLIVDDLDDVSQKVVSTYSQYAFDLAHEPLVRVSIVLNETKTKGYIIILSTHLIFDAVSYALLRNTIFNQYLFKFDGHQSISQVISGFHQIESLATTKTQQSSVWWDDYLPKSINSLMLNEEMSNPKGTQGFALIESNIDKQCLTYFGWDKLIPNALTSLQILLYRLFGVEKSVVGGVFHGRRALESNKIGCFTKLLPIINTFDEDKSITQHLNSNEVIMRQLIAHGDVNINELNQQLNSIDGFQGYQVVVVFQNSGEQSTLTSDSIHFKYIPIANQNTKYPLTITIRNEDGVQIEIAYDSHKFSSGLMDAFCRYFTSLLTLACQDAPEDLLAHPLISKDTLFNLYHDNQLIQEAGVKQLDLISAFKSKTWKHNQVACQGEQLSLTFAELDHLSDQIAYHLIDNGIIPGDCIAIDLQDSHVFIISIFGVLKAGAYYLPIDINGTKASRDELCQRAKVKYYIDDEQYLKLTKTTSQIKQTLPQLTADMPAVLIFTSGTTSDPKGIIISHGAIVSLVTEQNYIKISESDRLIQLSNRLFDASLFEIFGALLIGATLVCPPNQIMAKPEDLIQYLYDNKVNILWLTKTYFEVLFKFHAHAFEHVEQLIVGGEALNVDTMNEFCSSYPNIRVSNGYGPTEATTFACTKWFEHQITTKSAPIGKPIARTSALVLSENNEILAPYEFGEIGIHGPGVMNQYLDDEAHFVSIQHLQDKATYYKTGDFGYINHEFDIMLVGRKDDIIKLRGFRVSLNVIALRLMKLECHIEMAHLKIIDDKLSLFVSGQNLTDAILASTLKKLPTYMKPHQFYILDKIPFDKNGKIDGKALLSYSQQPKTCLSAATEDSKRQFINQCRNIMEVESLQLKDTFFGLGGDSIQAIQLVGELNKQGMEIQLNDILNGLSFEELYHGIASHKETNENLITDYEINQQPFNFTALQNAIYFQSVLAPTVPLYNIPLSICFTQTVGKAQIQGLIDYLVSKHPALRLCIQHKESQPYWVESTVTPHLKHLRQPSDSEINLLVKTPVSLKRGELYTITLIEYKETFELLFVFHHMIIDAWSVNLILNDIYEYFNKAEHSQEESKGFLTYLNDPGTSAQKSHRTVDVSRKPQRIDWDTINPISRHRSSYDGALSSFKLSLSTKQLELVAKQFNVSEYQMSLMLCFIALSRWSKQNTLSLGVPTFDRHQPSQSTCVGLMLNTQIMTLSRQADIDLGLQLHVLRDQLREEIGNSVSYHEMSRTYHVNEFTNPLFNVMFVFESLSINKDYSDLFTLGEYPLGVAKEELLVGIHVAEEINIDLEYSTDIFQLYHMDLLKNHMHQCFKEAIELLDHDNANLTSQHDLTVLSKVSHDIDEIFSRVLTKPLNRGASFFEQGGHSLQLLAIHRALLDKGYTLTIADLMTHAVPEDLIRLLSSQKTDASEVMVELEVELKQWLVDPEKPNLIFIMPSQLDKSRQQKLVDALSGSVNLLLVSLPEVTQELSVEHLSALCLEAVQSFNPGHQEVICAGWSLGGLVAHCLASSLEQQPGYQTQLILLDSYSLSAFKDDQVLDQMRIQEHNQALSLLVSYMPCQTQGQATLIKCSNDEDNHMPWFNHPTNGWPVEQFNEFNTIDVCTFSHYELISSKGLQWFGQFLKQRLIAHV